MSVPLFHVTGCNSQLIVTTQMGGHDGRSCRRSTCRRSCRPIVDEQINILTSVPAIYWLAMSQPNFADFDMSAASAG